MMRSAATFTLLVSLLFMLLVSQNTSAQQTGVVIANPNPVLQSLHSTVSYSPDCGSFDACADLCAAIVFSNVVDGCITPTGLAPTNGGSGCQVTSSSN